MSEWTLASDFYFKDCLLVLGCAHDDLKQTLVRVAAEQAY